MDFLCFFFIFLILSYLRESMIYLCVKLTDCLPPSLKSFTRKSLKQTQKKKKVIADNWTDKQRDRQIYKRSVISFDTICHGIQTLKAYKKNCAFCFVWIQSMLMMMPDADDHIKSIYCVFDQIQPIERCAYSKENALVRARTWTHIATYALSE